MKACPHCKRWNDKEMAFCQYCGVPLDAPPSKPAAPAQVAEPLPAETGIVTKSVMESAEFDPWAAVASPPQSLSVGHPVRSDRAPVELVSGAALQTAQPAVSRPGPTVSGREQGGESADSTGQMGSGKRSFANIWGPFAGRGERGRHVSWSLDRQGANADRLRDFVTSRFQQRQIPNANVHMRFLTARGLIVENRPYYLVVRGITTIGLHISRFGDDLFISMVTYARGPIDPLRVLVLMLLILFQLFMSYFYGVALSNSVGTFNLFGGYTGDPGMAMFLLCCIGPAGLLNTLLLALAGIHSVYKFLTIRDPFMLLRRPHNEFEQDDIMALEKTVEETVRQAMDGVGLDRASLTAASQYGIERRQLI